MKNKIVIGLAFILGLLGTPIVAHAQGADFTVNPVYSADQTDKSLGYIDLKVNDKKDYPISVNVQNMDKNEAGSYTVSLVNATTNDNGDVNYTPSKQNLVKSSDPLLKDLVPKNMRSQKITLKAGENKTVSFNLKLPAKNFKGQILGSVYVLRNSKNLQEKKQFGINNRFAMTIPVMLTQANAQVKLPKLTMTKAFVTEKSGQPQIAARIQNASPLLFGKIKIAASVSKAGQEKALYTKNVKDYAMAPRSIFNFKIDTGKRALKPGKYVYKVNLKSGKRDFHLKKNFVVKKAEQNVINKRIPGNHKAWWLLGSVGVIILIVIISIAYWLGRRKAHH